MATSKSKTSTLPARTSIELPTLEGYLSGDKSFVSAYARTLAAIAGADGVVSLSELDILMDVAHRSASPALVGALIFHALHEKANLDDALKVLSKSNGNLAAEQREAALTDACPLLEEQGPKARQIGRRLATALGKPAPKEGDSPEDHWNLLDDLSDKARRLFKGEDLADAVIECGRTIGNATVIADYRAYRKGELSSEQLYARIQEIERWAADSIGKGEASQTLAAAAEESAASLLATSTELRSQVEQRLELVDARIRFERETFAQEIDDITHDAGNSLERGISDRLMTDAWKEAGVWESIGRTQFGQDAERRIDRALRRREEGLRLLHEDLRLFRAQVGIVHLTLFKREHHARLALLMPPMRLATRAISNIDSLAGTTLGVGAVATAGAGAATYWLGPALLLPAIAPALPYVGGALLAAGLIKWLMPKNEQRKYAEIRDKRTAFEKLIRDQLVQAQATHDQELESARADFSAAALGLLTPIALEAEAAQRLPRLRKQLLEQSLHRTKTSIRQLNVYLKRDANTLSRQ